MNGPPATGEQPRRVAASADGATAWLWIENVARLNAMSLSMWHELGEHVSRFAADPSVQLLVIAGRGGKAFCAGGDISEFGEFIDGGSAAEQMRAYAGVGQASLQ